MFGWIPAAAGLTMLRCPYCRKVQARSRRQDPVSCKACRKSFSRKAGHESLERGFARRKRD